MEEGTAEIHLYSINKGGPLVRFGGLGALAERDAVGEAGDGPERGSQNHRSSRGQLRSAPRESLLEEAGLNELKEAECRWAIQLEKCLRQKDGDPRRALATETVTQRLKSEGWRRRATARERT